MRRYEYTWKLVSDTNRWLTLSIQFTRWQILAINFNNTVSGGEKESIRILALLILSQNILMMILLI